MGYKIVKISYHLFYVKSVYIYFYREAVNISKQLQCVTYGNDITLHASVISSPPTPLIEWKKMTKLLQMAKIQHKKC